MKTSEPFYGVRLPEVRHIVRKVPPEQRLEAARRLWRGASHREERYAAIALLELQRRELTSRDLGLLERLVRGTWWDVVDPVSVLVGDLLPAVAADVRAWAIADDMWTRRAAIICQRKRRDATDLGLLRDCIEANLADREFFIRKAIGWALRSYAYTDPRWVEGYVGELGERLSPLSRREATKHLSTLLP